VSSFVDSYEDGVQCAQTSSSNFFLPSFLPSCRPCTVCLMPRYSIMHPPPRRCEVPAISKDLSEVGTRTTQDALQQRSGLFLPCTEVRSSDDYTNRESNARIFKSYVLRSRVFCVPPPSNFKLGRRLLFLQGLKVLTVLTIGRVLYYCIEAQT